jgi:hypothetical protein
LERYDLAGTLYVGEKMARMTKITFLDLGLRVRTKYEQVPIPLREGRNKDLARP